MDYVIGVDVGTTGTKAALYTSTGDLIDTSFKAYSLVYPKAGWVEQNPEDWWRAVANTVHALVTKHDCGKAVQAISLSTQAGSLVLLDESWRPIRPAISWLDRRAADHQTLLEQSLGPEEVYRSTGWNFLSGLSMPALFFLMQSEPDLMRTVRYVATTADYLHRRLTGTFAIDPTNLALTEFLDLQTGKLWERPLHLMDLKSEMFPAVVKSGTILGPVLPEAQVELGLGGQAVVVVGAHDQYCASIGAGAINDGDCVLSAGTAWVLLATVPRLAFESAGGISSGSPVAHPGFHAAHRKFGLMTTVSFGGNSLTWFRDALGTGCDYDDLDRHAAEIDAGASGLTFVPPLVAESGGGAFLGIDGSHSRGHFVRAIYEGVAVAARLHLDRFHTLGIAVDHVVLIGGATRSSVWSRIVADALGIRVDVPEVREAGCTGAAMLACVGAGMFPALQQATEAFCSKGPAIYPDPVNRTVYDSRLETIRTYLDTF